MLFAVPAVPWSSDNLSDQCFFSVDTAPRKDHALIMARFAMETNIKMRELVHQLEHVLGSDTSTLALRTGLHSGPVTAGVLRGDKGRFQVSIIRLSCTLLGMKSGS